MEEERLLDLRIQVKYRLLDYLRAARLPLDESDPEMKTTVCPHCGKPAQILEASLDVSRTFWSCGFCNKNGDAVAYAMTYFGFQTEFEAIKGICRALGIRIRYLDTTTANEIMDTVYPEKVRLIDGLIGKGLYLIVGAPKIGKSWVALQIAHTVSTGGLFWDRKTQKCDVLYFSLEDPEDRIQTRLVNVSGGETGNIYFATDSELLGDGFEEQVIHFLKERPDVKLVIVDTLQKVRKDDSRSYSYSGDYAAMTVFKRLAERFGITILLIHHTRKMEAKDAMAKISGTNGIFGCADGAMVMERSSRLENMAVVSATSRDFKSEKINLRLDPETMCWEFAGYAEDQQEETVDPVLEAVGYLVQQRGVWKGTATELLDTLQAQNPKLMAKPNTLSRKLNAGNAVLKDFFGVGYAMHRQGNDKVICLERLFDTYDISGAQ